MSSTKNTTRRPKTRVSAVGVMNPGRPRSPPSSSGVVQKPARKLHMANARTSGGVTSSGKGPGSMRRLVVKRGDATVFSEEMLEWKYSYTIDEKGVATDGRMRFEFQPGDQWTIGVLNAASSVMSFSF